MPDEQRLTFPPTENHLSVLAAAAIDGSVFLPKECHSLNEFGPIPTGRAIG